MTLRVWLTTLIFLFQRCDRTIIYDSNSTDQYHTEYNCRRFPSKQYHDCQREVDNYCILWFVFIIRLFCFAYPGPYFLRDTAGYASQLSLVFVGAALVALLVVSTGFSTHSRRRTAWQGVAALTGLHGLFSFVLFVVIKQNYVPGALQIVAMAIVVNLHKNSAYPLFGEAKLSEHLYIHTTLRTSHATRYLILLEHNIMVPRRLHYRRSSVYCIGC